MKKRNEWPVLPLPTRIFSEDNPSGKGVQTEEMSLVERRILEMADRFGAPLGMNRRRFLQSSCGMAAAFLAMNSVFGPLFNVSVAEAADPEAAAARNRQLADQFIFDVQTHFVYPEYPGTEILELRKMAKEEDWNPDLEGEQTLDKIQFENFFDEVFLQSQTALVVLSSAPNDDPKRWFIHNEDVDRARSRIREMTGSKRLYSHAVFTPGRPGWMEDLDRAVELKPDAWKGYTVGQPFGHSDWPWRMDDEKLVYPAYERMQKAGITTVCIHKGLLPEDYEKEMAKTWRYGNVDDVGKAAKDWPQLNFLIYHAGLRSGEPPSEEEKKKFEETGEIEWVSDLARIPEKYGVNNVYAEIGSSFAITALSAPRYCAGMLGTLIKRMGEDKVLWGTDSVWYGSPQWQIEAFRRIEIPQDLQKKFGYSPLGPADGPLKNRIFADNAAPVYPFSKEGLDKDKLAERRKKA